MSLYCTLLMGANVPTPISTRMTQALQQVEIIHHDAERSGFQISFALGRAKVFGNPDYALLKEAQLQPFNRVIIIQTWNGVMRRLMDGMITHLQINPGDGPGTGNLVVTGEDVSVAMDREEKIVTHPGQSDTAIVGKIISQYSQYNLIPNISTPANVSIPDPVDHVPVQHGTDWSFLQQLAQRYGYVFYVAVSSAANIAYWGPPVRVGAAQAPISINLGASTNAINVRFQHRILAPTTYTAMIQDSKTNQISSISTKESSRFALANKPALTVFSRQLQLTNTSGLTSIEAESLAQAKTNFSTDNVITAEGELNVVSYGKPLQARSTVEVRGAGSLYNGKYYVKRVSHVLQPGQYKQQFLLAREGTGTLTNTVLF